MDFRPVELSDYEWIYRFTSEYGEGSCQHSPVTMYSLTEKYGDEVCREDGFLYTLRSRRGDGDYRVYLAPLGAGDRRAAYERILADAKEHGKKARFLTLTESAAAYVAETFPDRFAIREERDLAEYFCRTAETATFAGGALQRRRREVNTFWNRYGHRARVTKLTPEDFPEIRVFEQRWLALSEGDENRAALEIEARMIEKQLAHYDALRLSGIVIRVDDRVEGFGYGVRLSDRVYDALVEKGNWDIPNITRVLRQEATRRCAMDCEFVNMEEDLGIPGLRALKLAYHPAYLLRKFIAEER